MEKLRQPERVAADVEHARAEAVLQNVAVPDILCGGVGGRALNHNRHAGPLKVLDEGVDGKLRRAAPGAGTQATRGQRRRVDEDEEYTGAATLRDRKRAAKEEKYRRQAGIIAPLEEEIGDFDKRHVGKKIMENRGLTPHRSKDHKNPRKRLRDKFAKAQIRRKGQVRSMREDGGGYAGEATGIKTSVSKSRRFGK